jgi:hypothetical protein
MATTTTTNTTPPASTSPSPTTCWKCRNPLRHPNAPFCNTCGAVQKRDADPAAAQQWQQRIRQAEQASWARSLFWLLAFPLAPLTFPWLVARSTRRLRAHIQQRLAAPAFAAARFTQSDEGKQIAQRLASSAGRLTSRQVLAPLMALLLLLTTLGMMFIPPLFAPSEIGYEHALDGVANIRPARRYIYISSKADYDHFWSRINSRDYDHFAVTAYPDYDKANIKSAASIPAWSGSEYGYGDTPSDHRPYEYVYDTRDGFRPNVHRVSSIGVYADYTFPFGVAFGVCIVLLYLLFLFTGVIYWLRFTRHTRAEALAAAYARGDTALHDRLLADARLRGWLVLTLGTLVALFPIQLVIFPILSALTFTLHERWERNTGVAAALGLPSP